MDINTTTIGSIISNNLCSFVIIIPQPNMIAQSRMFLACFNFAAYHLGDAEYRKLRTSIWQVTRRPGHE